MSETKTGWFGNHRTLAEQLLGLGPALAYAKGASVLDVGCAEGLIALEFAKAGAARVHAFDNNPDAVNAARKVLIPCTGCFAQRGDINEPLPEWLDRTYTIVLALAVLHKAVHVENAARRLAASCRELLVIRLQAGSEGIVKAKHHKSECDLRVLLPDLGFTMERQELGPRGEWVQYWRRMRSAL